MPRYRAGDLRVRGWNRVTELRHDSTDAERALWRLLRGRQLAGRKFRRQHEFGGFVLDFFCADAHLAIEVDGGQHLTEEGVARDLERTRFLEANGIRVLRFTNTQVLSEIDAVGEAILRELLAR
jgi:very-short-patch-repair endonuclease